MSKRKKRNLPPPGYLLYLQTKEEERVLMKPARIPKPDDSLILGFIRLDEK